MIVASLAATSATAAVLASLAVAFVVAALFGRHKPEVGFIPFAAQLLGHELTLGQRAFCAA